MSDTPRTDAAIIKDKMILSEVGLLEIVDAGTARQLERELHAAEARVRALEEEIARLEILAATAASAPFPIHDHMSEAEWAECCNLYAKHRDAIDAARGERNG